MPFDKTEYWANKGKKQPKSIGGLIVCARCMDRANAAKGDDRTRLIREALRGPFVRVGENLSHHNCPNV